MVGSRHEKVTQCIVCSQVFSDQGSKCSYCNNEMRNRGKRRAEHLADASYREDVKRSSLMRRRLDGMRPDIDADSLARRVAEHLIALQQE